SGVRERTAIGVLRTQARVQQLRWTARREPDRVQGLGLLDQPLLPRRRCRLPGLLRTRRRRVAAVRRAAFLPGWRGRLLGTAQLRRRRGGVDVLAGEERQRGRGTGRQRFDDDLEGLLPELLLRRLVRFVEAGLAAQCGAADLHAVVQLDGVVGAVGAQGELRHVVPDDPGGPVLYVGGFEAGLEVAGGDGLADGLRVGGDVHLERGFVADPGVPVVQVAHAEEDFGRHVELRGEALGRGLPLVDDLLIDLQSEVQVSDLVDVLGRHLDRNRYRRGRRPWQIGRAS